MKTSAPPLYGCRVVITGLGLVSILGCDVDQATNRLLDGDCPFQILTNDNYDRCRCKVVGAISSGDTASDIDDDVIFSRFESRHLPLFVRMGGVAAQKALNDAQWFPSSREDSLLSGVVMGTGSCGVAEFYWGMHKRFFDNNPRAFRPYTMIAAAPNSMAALISMKNQFLGLNFGNSDACASGSTAIIHAAQAIARGEIDIAVAGSSEAPINPAWMEVFDRLKILARGYEEAPHRASRPWSHDRNGFVLSEGAGAVVVERLEHAQERGAPIYAELLGFGVATDGFHLTQPSPDGDGQIRSMRTALQSAGLSGSDIQYVNAHATSTPLGDGIELESICQALGEEHAKSVPISSLKGNLGHSLASCGSIELILALKSLQRGKIPATANLTEPDSLAQGYNLIRGEPHSARIERFMKNSFGFGGINASLILGMAPIHS